MDNLAASAPELAPLVAKYGATAVWHGALELFEFPPSWGLSGGQVVQLGKYLVK